MFWRDHVHFSLAFRILVASNSIISILITIHAFLMNAVRLRWIEWSKNLLVRCVILLNQHLRVALLRLSWRR